MPVFEPHTDSVSLQHRLESGQGGLIIVCYCAAWCDTCTQYRQNFDALAAKWPTHTFVWVDIEENPELLDDEDIENFPTILIQGTAGNFFFGTLLPYISHLEKLVERTNKNSPVITTGPADLHTLMASAT